ncbi:glycerol-3-phosphate dehydrogenase [bacterium]|jgi:glycerol-3-phosphate dehydrogenase|nr:glycerol-3-phosphate dehydrogenase [Candidatus Pelagibacter bacterium]MDA7442885.1 glycerol-3-phosphate dehydrogenase [Candidatus Pelagibacter ubique]MDC1388050.1 glycerol-3-phosphate dehydrogenase [bacterium]MDA7453660.1 glycerol-3-phosphate dehydrogenase [Candidatus Pelagibacter ubique]MDA7478919.1 glycerol-3-phosphate dehydrogenase [Candidatus Pelagibacter ubique]MDB2693173.1 glycerol-3-phosphate dehydrogenase [Candidatus Pelagibacter bacterium]
MSKVFDLFIIGGGINGAGLARDAAGRGLSVCLADKGEIGGATSSWSTKLIHGGLRYLENYEFKLVRESLKEREIIYKIAKPISKPIPFIIPYVDKIRPAWLIKMGLFLYDNLGGKTIIPKSNTLDISKKLPNILKKEYKTGFQYFDVQIDDKKLTKLNIKSAKKYKAKVLEYNKVKKAEIDGNEWVIHLQKGEKIKSKILINASGPWINETLKKNIKIKSKNKIRLVKGSHIITKKLYKKDVAFTFQNTDKRIIFVIPYKKKFSLIGTTEVEVKSPENKEISKKEIQYLIRSVNNYLEKQISTKDIVDSYSGIRPLIEDFNQASKVTRDYIFDLNIIKKLPLLSIYGGKLTTYRKLAENVLLDLEKFLPKTKMGPWTHKKNLF